MIHSVSSDQKQCITVGATAFFAVTAITLLVVGILGASGAIHMASRAPRTMIGFSIAIFGGMVLGCIESVDRNKQKIASARREQSLQASAKSKLARQQESRERRTSTFVANAT